LRATEGSLARKLAETGVSVKTLWIGG